MVTNSKKDWDTKLRGALWAYKITFKVTTQAMPFSLVYGIKAILLVELKISSLQITVVERLSDTQLLIKQLEHLDGLNEARKVRAQHMEAIQQRGKIAFDKRHKVRSLRRGMLVLLQDAKKLDFPEKFDALQVGPYLVKEVFPNNSMQCRH